MIGAPLPSNFSDSLAKHTSKGMKERVMQGMQGLPNGDLPFGYRRYDKQAHPDKKGAVYVVLAGC